MIFPLPKFKKRRTSTKLAYLATKPLSKIKSPYVADTDFPSPVEVTEALRKRVEMNHYGYPYIDSAFEKSINSKLILYANQAGLAFGLLLNKLNIVECHAVRMSDCGLKLFQKSGIRFDYEKLIPLVKSSKDENKVCPIEKFLSEHSNPEEQWKFLKDRFQEEHEFHDSCKR